MVFYVFKLKEILLLLQNIQNNFCTFLKIIDVKLILQTFVNNQCDVNIKP